MAKCQKFWVWGTQKFQKTFFAQNHSIRENKVKKVKKDEKIFFFQFPYCLIWHLVIFEAENQLFRYVVSYIV